MKTEMIAIEKIDPPKDIIRDQIDPESVRELAESIREQGLLQPILLRSNGNRYEVVAGHRRLLAHRLIGLTEIKAFVRTLTDEETLVLRATENLQREDLSPIEEAKVYGRLRQKMGLSIEEIARKMGKNRITVKKHLKLLELPEYIQDYVDRGTLSMQVGLKLNEIKDEELQRYYVGCAVEHGITAKVADMWVDDYEASKRGNYYESSRGRGEEEIKIEPAPIFVTCFVCHGPAEVGDITSVQICRACYNEVLLSRSKKKSMKGGIENGN